MQSIDDQLLGKLLVRESICSQEQIDECLRVQSSSRSPLPLGDILQFKGYASEAQIKALLGRQSKKVMSCAPCKLTFTVLTMSEGKSARCPRCKAPLKEKAPDAPARVDAEFATQRFKVQAAPSGPRGKFSCIICDTTFEGALDGSGRVRCPSCQSTFTPGR